ncbi:MAG: hypothetical protein R3B41_01795 [Candidatus Doudnabacteria bacterium]
MKYQTYYFETDFEEFMTGHIIHYGQWAFQKDLETLYPDAAQIVSKCFDEDINIEVLKPGQIMILRCPDTQKLYGMVKSNEILYRYITIPEVPEV